MKRLFAIVFLCGFLIPFAYGETINYGNGDKYVGDVVNGVPHGQGTHTYPDGRKYVGEFKDNKYHGQGTFTFGKGEWEGNKYVGEFKDNKSHGQGTYTYPNGSKYVGEFKDNKFHGQGTYTWGKGEFEGDKYVGEFKDEKKHGHGTYTRANGDKYVGEFKDDNYNGQGTYTVANGDKYVGEFKDHNYNGQGTYTRADGRKYVGEWRGNKPWTGVEYSASGAVNRTVSSGKWCKSCTPTKEQLALVASINKSSSGSEKVAEKPAKTTTVQTASAEIVFWQSIQNSNDPDMYRAYVNQFPDGVYVALAKIKLKKLGGDTAVISSIPDLDYGKYYALVIGNDRYQYLDNLETPREDARLIAATLKRDYGFDVNLLSNATRADMFEALEHYRRTSTSQDNLLIYYAGHGVLDQEADEGFWLPVDAKEDSQLNWIPNADIIRSVSSMQAKHVMVVADSCFSGTLIRALTIKQKTPDYLTRISKKKARVAMTSGSDEPVTDVGGGGNSAFAKAFLNLLDENTGVLDGHSMFTQLRRRVMINTKQTPQYGDMRGHEDGDFLFVRQ